MIPLVTPTSQIVGTQAVINVLSGSRYASITRESAGVLRGEYGATPAPVNPELQARALDGDELITSRPADHLSPELDEQTAALGELAKAEGFQLATPDGAEEVDDVLTYALFPQVATKFFANRDNPDAFEPAPSGAEAVKPTATASASGTSHYTVAVDGHSYQVVVAEGQADLVITPGPGTPASPVAASGASAAVAITAGLAGTIHQVLVQVGDQVQEGQVVCILEAMKMETEVRAGSAGTVAGVSVSVGDAVVVGQELLTLG